MNLRKFIREQIEQTINKQDTEEKFDQDIVYLKGFTLNKKEYKSGSTIWIFEHKTKDYTVRFYIQKEEKTGFWFGKVFVYWKEPTKELTSARGKDFEFKFGPYGSYKEMVSELNRKLANNPLMSKEIYLDDNKTQFDKDVIEMINVFLKHGEKLNKIKDEHFKDLKRLYNDTHKIKSEEEMIKYVDKIAPEEEDKQRLLLTLQKMYLIDFYLRKEQMDSLFEN